MKYTFVTDCHQGATNALPNIKFNPENPNEIFLGDNLDLANTKKSEVQFYLDWHAKLKSLYGPRMVTGNHSRMLPIGEHYIFTSEKNGRVFCTHGDNEANHDKWTKYRAKPKGAGFLKRGIWVNLLEAYEDIFDRKVRSEILDRMAERAKSHACDVFACGHYHLDKIMDIEHNGIRIIILPRGATTLDL